MWLYTPPVYISHINFEGPLTPERMDRFVSTIVSIIISAHADILQLFAGPPEVCAANERQWFILALVYTTGGVYQDMWL